MSVLEDRSALEAIPNIHDIMFCRASHSERKGNISLYFLYYYIYFVKFSHFDPYF